MVMKIFKVAQATKKKRIIYWTFLCISAHSNAGYMIMEVSLDSASSLD